MQEKQFKTWFVKNWDGWVSSYEPRKGGTVGIADLQILVKGRLVPIELKVGELVDNLTRERPLLKTERVRPAQIKWHYDLAKAGGISFVLVGVGQGDEPEHMFKFGGMIAGSLLKTVEIHTHERVSISDFTRHLTDTIAFRMGCHV